MRRSYLIAPLVAIAGITTAAAFGRASDPVGSATVTIITKEFEFDAPASIPAGVTTFELVNKGKQLHHAMLVRLDQGKGSQDLGEAFASAGPTMQIPAWAVLVGGPNAVDPGGTTNATVVLRPGRYAWVCVIPDTDHAPHMSKGMIREFEVTAPAPRGDLPAPDISISLMDYEFKLSKPITAGRHTIRVRNMASQPHEIEIMKLAPGKTLDDLKTWMQTEQGPPPASAVGGVAPLNKGHANNATIEFTPGEYAFVCFVPDNGDGKPHFVHGMIHGFTVR